MSIKSVPSNHLTLCLFLLLLPSIFFQHQGLSNELALHTMWPMYWSFSFSFSISPSNEYSGLIWFKVDCMDLLAVQGTMKSLLLHHSSKASILQHSAFIMVQLSYMYMTTRKSMALAIWIFVYKVCLCFLKYCQCKNTGLGAKTSSRRSSQPRNWTYVSCNACTAADSLLLGHWGSPWQICVCAFVSLSVVSYSLWFHGL